VYEKKKDKDKAIETYRKLLDVFGGDQYVDARKQINTLIDNATSGKGNLAPASSLKESPSVAPTEIPPGAESVSNTAPVISAPAPSNAAPKLPVTTTP